MKKNYAYLHPNNRDRIAVMYNKGTSISDISQPFQKERDEMEYTRSSQSG